jgi:hypothetical protein
MLPKNRLSKNLVIIVIGMKIIIEIAVAAIV